MYNEGWWALAMIAGLTVVTLLTRGFFMLPDREVSLPAWLKRGLRYAPLAALAAVIIPEMVITDGMLTETWRDARLFAIPVAVAYYLWRKGILGTIVVGMAVYLPLRLTLGW